MPLPFHSQIQSLVPTGTAPLSITSTTVNANLNADLLDGQHGSYFENRDITAVGFASGSLTFTRAAGNITISMDGRYVPLSGGTMTGSLIVQGGNASITAMDSGNAAQWYGKVATANGTSNRQVYLGTYGAVAAIASIVNSTGAWNDLYVNTVDGSTGGTVRMPSSVLINGNQTLHAGNYNSYALPLSGGTLTGNLNLSAATLLNIGQQARIQFSYSNLQTVDSGSDRAGWMWNSYYDWSGTPSYKFWSTNAQGASMLHMSPTQLTFYTKAGPSTANAAFTWDASNVVLHAGNYNSYVLAASGTAASLSIGGSAAQLNGQAASFYQNAGNLNAGTLPSARLSGTYTIDILGAASSGSRLGQWDGTTYNTGSNSIGSSGGRGTSLAPNTYVKQVSFEFKNTTFTSMTGNYGGLITIAPWDGTTASTGDPNYQILINPAAANSTAAPVIRIRAGIDTTWGSWATLIHDGNFTTAIPNSGVTAGTYNNVTVDAKGRVTGGSNVSYLTGNQSISLSGDVTGTGTTAITTTIANNAVTNAKLNTMGAGTIKGNNGGVANTPSDLTAAQVAAMLSGQAMNIAGSSSSCTGSAAQLNGQAASYYENRDTTAVGISAGVLTLTRAAGNLTTTIGGRVVAWCDFNGNFATTQTPNAHFNVSSITKNATGDYTVNFSSALANANYVVAGSAQLDAPSPGQSNYNVMVAVPRRSGAKATGSCRIVCEYPLGVTLYDSVSVGVAFIAA